MSAEPEIVVVTVEREPAGTTPRSDGCAQVAGRAACA